MCLSGYIFTYLTDGHRVNVLRFWLNRILRLFPLLLFWGLAASFYKLYKEHGVLLFHHFDKQLFIDKFSTVIGPSGAWTVFIELRYYLIFPIFLILLRRFNPGILIGLAIIILVVYRVSQWMEIGSIQGLSYGGIYGRADQFLLGTMAFYVEKWIKNYPLKRNLIFNILGIVGFSGIIIFYQYFVLEGGYCNYNDEYPSKSIIWVFIPTLEGLFYSMIIIYYVQQKIPEKLDKIFSSVGKWSYSIYLGHFHLFPYIFLLIATTVGMPGNFYGRFFIALLVFPLIVLFSSLTYKIIEKPFLRLRKNYLLPL